jgi:antitoxin component YwqK of YwqJK toxin-antitoxin module|tara:strand:- start:99 stop:1925 length:1827 start_codon:yes stop_codon:yes gene_type:complete
LNKRTIILLSLNLFITSLFSQVQWKELDNRGGLVYAPGIEKPYTGNVLGSYDDGNNKMEGSYVDGLMDGMWTYYYPDGVTKAKGRFIRGDGGNIHKISGIPKNGRNGEWIIYYPSGNVNAKYQYDVNGKFDQERLELHDNGKEKILMHYVNGTPDGRRLEWYSNEQKKLNYFYENGKKHGEWTSWYKGGTKKHQYFYDRGKEIRTKTIWWSNGNKKIEGNFKGGRKDGQFIIWYKNGQKKLDCFFVDGVKDGTWTSWYKNGQKKMEGVCRDDKALGEWTYYNEDGSIKKIRNYNNGFDMPLSMKPEKSSFQSILTKPDDLTLIQTYPARPLLRSLVVPGWGQMYNKSPWWKTALFAGIEVAGIVGIVQLNKKAEKLRLEYEDFADEHWDFSRWIRNTPVNISYWSDPPNAVFTSSNYYVGDATLDDVIIDGTHQLDILYNGQIKSSNCFNDNGEEENNCVDFVDFSSYPFLPNYSLLDSMQVIKDLHFYENIGKYDQFVGGWDDLVDAESSSIWWIKEKTTEDTVEILIMTKNKEKYLDMRYRSNTYLKMATYAVSAVMFNHVISALEAVWTSQSNARKKKTYDTSIGLFYNKNTQYGIGGLSVAISW